MIRTGVSRASHAMSRFEVDPWCWSVPQDRYSACAWLVWLAIEQMCIFSADALLDKGAWPPELRALRHRRYSRMGSLTASSRTPLGSTSRSARMVDTYCSMMSVVAAPAQQCVVSGSMCGRGASTTAGCDGAVTASQASIYVATVCRNHVNMRKTTLR